MSNQWHTTQCVRRLRAKVARKRCETEENKRCTCIARLLYCSIYFWLRATDANQEGCHLWFPLWQLRSTSQIKNSVLRTYVVHWKYVRGLGLNARLIRQCGVRQSRQVMTPKFLVLLKVIFMLLHVYLEVDVHVRMCSCDIFDVGIDDLFTCTYTRHIGCRF